MESTTPAELRPDGNRGREKHHPPSTQALPLRLGLGSAPPRPLGPAFAPGHTPLASLALSAGLRPDGNRGCSPGPPAGTSLRYAGGSPGAQSPGAKPRTAPEDPVRGRHRPPRIARSARSCSSRPNKSWHHSHTLPCMSYRPQRLGFSAPPGAFCVPNSYQTRRSSTGRRRYPRTGVSSRSQGFAGRDRHIPIPPPSASGIRCRQESESSGVAPIRNEPAGSSFSFVPMELVTNSFSPLPAAGRAVSNSFSTRCRAALSPLR